MTSFSRQEGMEIYINGPPVRVLFEEVKPNVAGRHVAAALKRYLITGAFVLAPLVITLYILTSGFSLLDRLLGAVVARLLGHPVPGAGAVLTILLTLMVGIIATNVIGRRLIAFGERVLARIPVVRAIYVSVKQLLEAFTVSNRAGFQRVVLVEHPRPGLWAIGFVTSRGATALGESLGRSVTTVFIPTAPNPTSGFLVVVPDEEVIPLSISIEEAFKAIVSGGIVWSGEEKRPN